ncbi:MAG: type IX secretion system protein PorQ [Bacteroidetes bacterium]|nr:MAG: type IX secretion system protein PorQ [Bacteroidota bacterium]
MKILGVILCLIGSLALQAQIGGKGAFSVLDLPFNARSAALGNDFISSRDQDVNMGVQNPALYNQKMDRHLGVNQGLLAGGINMGMISYGRKLNDSINWGASFRYSSYGIMDRYDEAGILTGKLYAGDFIFGIGASKKIPLKQKKNDSLPPDQQAAFHIGVNSNLLYGQYERQTKLGLAFDLAASYEVPASNFFLTAVLKNVGAQFDRSPSLTPWELQLAVAHKVKHAPFRFTLLMHHLNTFDLTYTDPNQRPDIDPLTGDTIPITLPGFGEKVFRHLSYQVELIFSKNLHLRTAFDYHRRQELKVSERPGIAGFSFGIGMYFKRFSLDYGLIAYSAAGYSNLITLTTNLEKWRN